jgi:hypothetical protein
VFLVLRDRKVMRVDLVLQDSKEIVVCQVIKVVLVLRVKMAYRGHQENLEDRVCQDCVVQMA